jgi:hypothetical protein
MNPARDYRLDPRGFGLHGLALAPGEIVRLTQDEVEAHPAWRAFGSQAGKHPPLRGRLATPVCSEDTHNVAAMQSTPARSPSSEGLPGLAAA